MRRNPKTFLSKIGQQGITLIEALVALLILALGVLGLAAVQARMLVETRTTNSRATAIWLIADLGDRIRMNVQGAQPVIATPGAIAISPYADAASGQNFKAPNSDPPTPDCLRLLGNNNPPNFCTPVQQAAYDLWVWRSEVANQLMNGVASITQAGPQQLQVVVAWRLNENTNTTIGTAPAQQASAQQLASQLQITAANRVTDLCNPAVINNFICHVDFIEIPSNV